MAIKWKYFGNEFAQCLSFFHSSFCLLIACFGFQICIHTIEIQSNSQWCRLHSTHLTRTPFITLILRALTWRKWLRSEVSSKQNGQEKKTLSFCFFCLVCNTMKWWVLSACRVECPECVRDFQHIFRLFTRLCRLFQLVWGAHIHLQNWHERKTINIANWWIGSYIFSVNQNERLKPMHKHIAHDNSSWA